VKAKPLKGKRDPRHGTLVGYSYHGCRCEKCVTAQREYSRGRWAHRLENLRPGDHGKMPSYSAGCRCEKCVQVVREYGRNRYQRLKKMKKGEKVDLSGLA